MERESDINATPPLFHFVSPLFCLLLLFDISYNCDWKVCQQQEEHTSAYPNHSKNYTNFILFDLRIEAGALS